MKNEENDASSELEVPYAVFPACYAPKAANKTESEVPLLKRQNAIRIPNARHKEELLDYENEMAFAEIKV